MVATQVFPFHHPAIDFLLLLAVADDAIGLVIIAAYYGEPSDFSPLMFLLVPGGALVAFLLRKVFHLQHWAWYVLLGGVPCWLGLLGAALHPALALVFVVPFRELEHAPHACIHVCILMCMACAWHV